MRIDFAIQTSNRTSHRLQMCGKWTQFVRLPSIVRVIGDEEVGGKGDYRSAIDKTLYAIDTFDPVNDWFYMVDDDGFVAFDRLVERLADCDPDEHHAIGRLAGKLSTDSAKFNCIHGGCGMALSRATVCALQQRLWAGEMVRHYRHSDATISINLHHIGVEPTHDERFTLDMQTKDGWIACHQPTNEDCERLANEIQGILKGV